MSKVLRVVAVWLALILTCAIASAQQPKRPSAKTQKPPAKKTEQAPKPLPEPPPPPPDLEIATQYTSGDKTTKSVVQLHANRQRIDYETELAAIRQCDAGKSIQLNQTTKTYLVADNAPAAAAPTTKKKGGRITYTTAVTDTGETKPMFGFTARHLTTVVSKQFSLDACDKKPELVEIDGWYIELPASVTCVGGPQRASEVRGDPKNPSCEDDVSFVLPEKAAGYPVGYTMKTTSGVEAPAVTTMEVIDLKRSSIEAQRFDVPADYVEVRTLTQLTADHRPGEDGPKKPGVTRIGVAPIANKSGVDIAAADVAQALAESLSEVQPDVIVLRGDSAEAIEADAKARSCDYILQNTIAEVKKPGKGMLGKIAGSSPDAFSAKVEFALTPPGQPKPAFSGSERSGTSIVQTAIGAAKRVSQYFPPMMMARYGYLNVFNAMSGAASPLAMQQTQDPVLSMMFSFVDRATGPKSQEALTTEQAAIAAALEREVNTVSTQLRRKPS